MSVIADMALREAAADRRLAEAEKAPDARVWRCENYLRARTGCYEWRCERYRAAALAMKDLCLSDDSLVVDVGAGWTELDHHLRTEHEWRGRYWPVDGMFDGVDLNTWSPPRDADFFVALEILEHLDDPGRLVGHLKKRARRGVVASVPNPRTTDVLGMDPTHVTLVHQYMLSAWGFRVEQRSFYGRPADSLFGVWRS
jgi:hypothetical protein